MERGGTVDWTEFTEEAVTGVFKSKGCPNGVSVRWTQADAKRAGTQNMTKFPRQMLKARVASDGVRMADPAVNQGRYTPEEVQDFEGPEAKRIPAEAEIIAPEPSQAVQEALQHTEEARENRDEVLAKHVYGYSAPAGCEECGSEVEVYESNSVRYPGRKIWMCKKAHETRDQMVAEGMDKAKAAAKVSKHFRTWAEPPQKGQAAAETGLKDSPAVESTPAVAAPDEESWADERARIVREVTANPLYTPAQRIETIQKRVNEALAARQMLATTTPEGF